MNRGRSRSGQYQRDPARDAAIREAIDAAKKMRDLSDVVGRHTTLKRRGTQLIGICPFHKERSPSFEVSNAKGVFHCYGCGAAGDHVTILMKLDGMTFVQAFEALTNDTFPAVAPETRAQQLAEDAAERAAAIAEARRFWDAAVPVAGTPAETYLRQARGITMPALPSCFRFGRVPTRKDDAGRWGPIYPALIGAVTIADDVVAIQRIFLRDDGTDKRWGKRSKLTLGRFVGGAVRMGVPKCGDTPVIVTEGPEDALSLAQELPDAPVWAALGTANMVSMSYGADVREVVLAGQNDAAGRTAIEKAASSLVERGMRVRTMWPDPSYKDWNDQLRGVRL